MQIVINISEKIYESVMNGTYCGTLYEELKNGIALPKGHGRLIDGDKLIRPEIQTFLYHLKNGDTVIPEIDILHAPTIIEADRSKEE